MKIRILDFNNKKNNYIRDNDRKSNFDYEIEMLKENLNHARHIETEILTFESIYMTLVAGVLALADMVKKDGFLVLMLYLALLLYSILNLCLLLRWQDVFK